MKIILIVITVHLHTRFAEGTQTPLRNDNAEAAPKVYDFIVVGGGTAGGVVASALCTKYSVLVIESGTVPPDDIYVPRLASDIANRPIINYHYRSTKQKDAALQYGGIVPVTAGRMLGGGTSHNALIWTRGSAAGYDDWAEITGDNSWQYKNMLKYFKQIENYHGSYSSNGQHGTDGPVDISEDTYTPGGDIWQKAGQELGYQVKDPNGPQTVGFGRTAFTKLKGRRVTSYTAYLEPASKKRGNRLSISDNSTATKILFRNKKADRVEFIRNGVAMTAIAIKEIILSAGTYVTPVLLIKSGVGPKDQVAAAKVTQVADLPVGKNFLDHPKLDLPFFVNNSKLSWNIKWDLTPEDNATYQYNGTGPLSASDQQMEAHVLSSRQKTENDELVHLNNLNPAKSSKVAVNQSQWPDLLISYTPFGQEPKSVLCTLGNYRPRSKGVLTFNASASATDEDNWPIMDFNYYNVTSDLDVMIDGINFCLQLMKTPAFQKVGATIGDQVDESCKEFSFGTREYWKCYIRYRTRTGYHSVGTCRMGKGSKDPNAVVDSKLKVIGVTGLRVIDASVMPTIINANTMAATYALGAKAADDILQEYRWKFFDA